MSHRRSTASATPLPPPRQSVAMPRFSVAALQRVEKRRQDTRAARADGVAERDRAAVDVDLVLRRCRARSAPRPPGPKTPRSARRDRRRRAASRLSRASRLHGFDRRHQHELRRQAAGRLADDPRQRRQPERPGALGRHDDERGGAVVDARRVAGRDRSVLLERRLQRGERLQRWCPAGSPRRASITTGSPLRCGMATGRISSLNHPASVARAAF